MKAKKTRFWFFFKLIFDIYFFLLDTICFIYPGSKGIMILRLNIHVTCNCMGYFRRRIREELSPTPFSGQDVPIFPEKCKKKI